MRKTSEDNYTSRLGATKYIEGPDKDGFVYKFFRAKKQELPIEKQKEIINKKKKYFGEYIPETILCDTYDGSYCIKQKFIKGKTLAQIDIETLSAETLYKIIDLIKRYLKYHKEQGGEMDLTGYQYYANNYGELIKKVRNFLKISKNFLTSTNIMISDDGDVYMIDICDSNHNLLPQKFKNFCAKPFIKRIIYKLESTLQCKLNYETKNNELFYTLNQDLL